MAIATVRTVAELRAAIAEARQAGHSIGLVPTMGALHGGHTELIRKSASRCDLTVVSIFVNPTQFAPGEDFEDYPRSEARDLMEAQAAGAGLAFLPDAAEVYPDGESTRVRVAALDQDYESTERPHFFTGVATVVTKLLNMVAPDRAFFGEKDFQQLVIIRRMVRDLCLPVEIVGCPIVRDSDGLALSSRNAYLSQPQRLVAARLNKVMVGVAQGIGNGEPVSVLLNQGLEQLLEVGFTRVDYMVLVDPVTLERLAEADRPGRLLVAARIGDIRLLDNCPVAPAAD